MKQINTHSPRRKGILYGILVSATLGWLTGCTYKEFQIPVIPVVDCNLSTLALTLVTKSDASTCLLIDGSFEVIASGGEGLYGYSTDGIKFQASGIFKNLGPGTYVVIVKDKVNCRRSISVDIVSPTSTLSGTAAVVGNSACVSPNGSILINATGGSSPYTYQLGNGIEGNSNSFSNLTAGVYSVIVRDQLGCIRTINAEVPRLDTGTSFNKDIKPIINAKCAISGCHNGDNGASRNWKILSNVQTNALNIKTRTTNKTMPLTGSLSNLEIQLIACWVDDGAKDN